MYEFDELSNMGFSSQQINQVVLLEPYFEKGSLLEHISPYTDVDLLRKLNNACKNKDIFSDHYAMERILDLLEKNIDFSELVDENLNYTQCVGIYKLLVEGLNQYIPFFKRNDISEKIIINALKDIDSGIDIGLYLKEKFTTAQIDNAQNAYKLGYLKIIDILDKFPDIVSLDAINCCIEKDVDPVWLHENLSYDGFNSAVFFIEEGIDIIPYIKPGLSQKEIILIGNLLQNEIADEELNTFLTKYPIYQYVSPRVFGQYIQAYKNGLDIEPLYKNNVEDNVLDLAMIIEHLDQEEIKKCKTKKDFEIKLMACAISNGRKDLIPILLNIKKPDQSAYLSIQYLLKYDTMKGCHHKITNLLYDKGADVFGDYKPEFEFNGKQKHYLAIYVYANHVDDKDIDLIRDNTISANVMEKLCEMMEEGLDIRGILKDANKLELEDINAIHKCMRLGFKVIKEDIEK